MFPVLSISITGLDSDANYSLMVDMECVDSKRYRYSFHQSKWTATGPGEAELPCRTFVHPDSPAKGSHWMKGSISFDKIKLTNNQMDQNGHIIVNSMHRYLPRIHLVRHSDAQDEQGDRSEEDRITVSFEETTFIAVTAYQNHRVGAFVTEPSFVAFLLI
ncbi:T-box [Ostertagia ostertagi]